MSDKIKNYIAPHPLSTSISLLTTRLYNTSQKKNTGHLDTSPSDVNRRQVACSKG